MSKRLSVLDDKGQPMLLHLEGRDISLDTVKGYIRLTEGNFPGKAGFTEIAVFRHASGIVLETVYKELLRSLMLVDGEFIIDMQELGLEVIREMSK